MASFIMMLVVILSCKERNESAFELACHESTSELACHESTSELASLSASGNRLLNWPLNRPLASLSACFSPDKNQASLPASGQ